LVLLEVVLAGLIGGCATWRSIGFGWRGARNLLSRDCYCGHPRAEKVPLAVAAVDAIG
jgi:hypothetical protein